MLRLARAAESCAVEKVEVVGDVTSVVLSAPLISKKFRPGHYAYFYVPSVCSNAWHPFTLNVNGDGNLVIMARSLGKWTQKLRRRAQNGELDRALLIGPYGGINPRYLENRSRYLLFAGGIGITPVISVLQHLLNSKYTERQQNRHVTLMWCVRDLSLIELPHIAVLFKALKTSGQVLNGFSVQVCVHVTTASNEADIVNARNATSSDSAIVNSSSSSSCVKFVAGRPELETYFEGNVDLATGINSEDYANTFVFACGPSRLQTEVEEIARKRGVLDVHTETFEL